MDAGFFVVGLAAGRRSHKCTKMQFDRPSALDGVDT